MKVLSYSFFDPKIVTSDRFWDKCKSDQDRYYYNIPSVILTNVLLFPDYISRVYITKNVINNSLWPIFEILSDYFSESGSLDIVIEDLDYLFTEPSILRMKPLWDNNIDIFHTRDIDSIATEVEYKYLKAFESSDYCIGSIRTHKNHFGGCRMLAGLSSFKPNKVPDNIKGPSFQDYYNKSHGGYGCDQDLMVNLFTTNPEFTESNYMDCKAYEQDRDPGFPCSSCNASDLNIEIEGYQKEILNKIKECGFENWAGEPIDTRGEYNNYILKEFPDIEKEIRKNKLLSDFYKL
jgi:hypothetical protein